MPRPPSRNDCPPGLEYLTQLDKVIAVVSAPLVESRAANILHNNSYSTLSEITATMITDFTELY